MYWSYKFLFVTYFSSFIKFQRYSNTTKPQIRVRPKYPHTSSSGNVCLIVILCTCNICTCIYLYIIIMCTDHLFHITPSHLELWKIGESWIMETWRILNYWKVENLHTCQQPLINLLLVTGQQRACLTWFGWAPCIVLSIASLQKMFKIWTHMGRVLLFEAKHCLTPQRLIEDIWQSAWFCSPVETGTTQLARAPTLFSPSGTVT